MELAVYRTMSWYFDNMKVLMITALFVRHAFLKKWEDLAFVNCDGHELH